MPELSQGQQLGLTQLRDIVDNSHGALELLEPPCQSTVPEYVYVLLSIETREYRTGKGIPFRDRERIGLLLHLDFPFIKPEIHFKHKRYIGTPHVQWGNSICLYQSAETEYVPSDGMFGFFQRVAEWMKAAGEGTLDPDDAPLHPPVTYASSATKFVARADTPTNFADDGIWIGRADLLKVRDDRFDVIGWSKLEDWGNEIPNHPIAAAILFDKPLASEFPKKVDDLIDLVTRSGLSFGLLYALLRLFAVAGSEEEHAYFILGAPMRRKEAGAPLRPHLTVWEIGPATLKTLRAIVRSKGDAAAEVHELAAWMTTADVGWCRVLEDRPEIVNRRDIGTRLAALTEKRILLLGCGALGSAVAEMVLRSGATKLHLVDNGIVKPGILVRQRYADSDIGISKASALQKRLQAIGLKCTVTANAFDLGEKALLHFTFSEWDLVIDTAASTNVGHRIEKELQSQGLPVPLISMSVSAEAANGSVLVKMPRFPSGPQHIARQAKIEAFANDASHPLVKAFWPGRDNLKIFQPEPGCSAPTFVGSAADIDHHTSSLLNVGLSRISSLENDDASLDLIAAPWLDAMPGNRSRLSYTFKSYFPQIERRHGYKVLRSSVAARDIETELKRIARTRSKKIETGGLIFGEIDDAHQIIWVDSVSGPPPDSMASEAQFLCGTSGTKALNAFKSKRSGQSSHFIGIWHTHPVSLGSPSTDDLVAMFQLLHLQDYPPRQVVMLIVGFAATRPAPNFYLYRRDEFELISVQEDQQGGAEQ